MGKILVNSSLFWVSTRHYPNCHYMPLGQYWIASTAFRFCFCEVLVVAGDWTFEAFQQIAQIIVHIALMSLLSNTIFFQIRFELLFATDQHFYSTLFICVCVQSQGFLLLILRIILLSYTLTNAFAAGVMHAGRGRNFDEKSGSA